MALVAAIWVLHVAGWRGLVGARKRPARSVSFERTELRRQRGEYIVEHAAACMMCHAPVDWKTREARYPVALRGAGGEIPPGRAQSGVIGANITPDLATGIGAWSDDEVARAIREGLDAQGRPLDPMMPYRFYRSMTDEDVAAVVVYLRSLPAVRRAVPRAVRTLRARLLLKQNPEPIFSPVALPPGDSPEARGSYLVQLANCIDCHTAQRREDGLGLPGMDYAGGMILEGPWGYTASANITPDASGISYYTPEMFIQTMRTGVGRDHELNPVMPAHAYGGMTEEDLRAIFAYLRTIKPVKHKVNNTLVPSLCRVCGWKHGLGDKN